MKETITVRTATEEDIDSICDIENACFATPWSRDSLTHDITQNKIAEYFVALIDHEIVGYVGIWFLLDEVHINNVAVRPESRRKHAAASLIEAIVKNTAPRGATAYTLEVRAGNEAAKNLYRRMHFKEVGVRKGYYQDNGEDAIIMWRTE